MYICICNPFTDKDVKKHLSSRATKTTPGKVYSACTNGEKVNCGNCTCELKSMVDHHNNALTIKELNGEMQKTALPEKETV